MCFSSGLCFSAKVLSGRLLRFAIVFFIVLRQCYSMVSHSYGIDGGVKCTGLILRNVRDIDSFQGPSILLYGRYSMFLNVVLGRMLISASMSCPFLFAVVPA